MLARRRADVVARARPTRGPSSSYYVPIAWKFAILTTALILAAMSWQTYTAVHVAQDGLDREINRKGTLLVLSYASMIPSEWANDLSHKERAEQTLSALRERAPRQVLDIILYSADGGAVATSTGKTRFTVAEGEELLDADASLVDVRIREFPYDGAPARSFARSLLPGLGTRGEALRGASAEADARTATGTGTGTKAASGGRVEVYISAAEIEEGRQHLASAMIRVSLLALLPTVLGTVLVGSLLTRPIRALLRDMRQVSLGHLEHQSAVRSSDELGRLAHAFNGMTAGLRTAQEAKIAQKSVERDLALAREIQARLIPASMPSLPRLDVCHHYSPAQEVGGDYCDYIPIGMSHAGFAVADAAGKGIPAALVMTMTRTLLRAAAQAGSSPAATVEIVNQLLTPDMRAGMFVTLTYLVIELQTLEVRLVRCGHNPPLYYSARFRKAIPLHPKGMALGLDREGDLFYNSTQVQRLSLQPGDILLAYTDGVVEEKDRASKEYSQERLSDALCANARGDARSIVLAVLDDLQTHRGAAPPSDDVTLLVLKAL